MGSVGTGFWVGGAARTRGAAARGTTSEAEELPDSDGRVDSPAWDTGSSDCDEAAPTSESADWKPPRINTMPEQRKTDSAARTTRSRPAAGVVSAEAR